MFSFVHVDDAAAATVQAVERGAPGIYNIVDDEPSSLHEWLPLYAKALGAKPPPKVPAAIARIFAGRYGLYLITKQRGASNEKAKKDLGWVPQYALWRTGLLMSTADRSSSGYMLENSESYP